MTTIKTGTESDQEWFVSVQFKDSSVATWQKLTKLEARTKAYAVMIKVGKGIITTQAQAAPLSPAFVRKPKKRYGICPKRAWLKTRSTML